MTHNHLRLIITLVCVTQVINVTKDASQFKAKMDEMMRPTIEAFQSEIDDLKAKYSAVVSEIDNLKGDLFYGITTNISKRVPGGSEGMYAFYAYSTYNQKFTSGHNRPVLYDGVVTNAGNTYDQTKGEFTCKVAGTYVFSWTSYILRGDVPTNLIHNAVIVAKSGTLFQATNVCVLYLDEGDTVYIRAEPRGNTEGAVWSWSSFSGFLLS